jgi:hypothetical protein
VCSSALSEKKARKHFPIFFWVLLQQEEAEKFCFERKKKTRKSDENSAFLEGKNRKRKEKVLLVKVLGKKRL